MGFLASPSHHLTTFATSRTDELLNGITSYANRIPDIRHATINAIQHCNSQTALPTVALSPTRRGLVTLRHTTRSEEMGAGALILSNSTACTSGASYPRNQLITDAAATVSDNVSCNRRHCQIEIWCKATITIRSEFMEHARGCKGKRNRRSRALEGDWRYLREYFAAAHQSHSRRLRTERFSI